VAPADLADAVLAAVRAAVDGGDLAGPIPDSVAVQRPRTAGRGDFATNVALRLARPAGREPREVAGLLAERLRAHPDIAAVEVAGPGFLNVTLGHHALGRIAAAVVTAGPSYGLPPDRPTSIQAAAAGPAAAPAAGPATAPGGTPAAAGAGASGLLAAWAGRVPVPDRGGEVVRLAGAGTVPAAALADAIGADAARYALARVPAGTAVELDLDRWARQTPDNPLHCVQYAHARLVAIGRGAAAFGVADPAVPTPAAVSTVDIAALAEPAETALLAALGDFPAVVRTTAHQTARYLEEVAALWAGFDVACRVLPYGDEEVTDLTRARLLLCAATRTVLANGLAALGIAAAEVA
jgi:arginyl-tRNA synthetase